METLVKRVHKTLALSLRRISGTLEGSYMALVIITLRFDTHCAVRGLGQFLQLMTPNYWKSAKALYNSSTGLSIKALK